MLCSNVRFENKKKIWKKKKAREWVKYLLKFYSWDLVFLQVTFAVYLKAKQNSYKHLAIIKLVCLLAFIANILNFYRNQTDLF